MTRIGRILAGARRRVSSVRFRIAFWHLLLLAGVLALTLLTMRAVLLNGIDERIDRELQQEARELRVLATGTDPTTGEPFGDDVARIFQVFMERNLPNRNETFVTYVDGRPHLRSLNEPPVRLDQDSELTSAWGSVEETVRGTLVDTDVGTVSYQAVPLRFAGSTRGVFLSAWFRDREAAEVDEVVTIAAFLSGLALVLATSVVWNVTGRVLRPVTAVVATAKQISESDLGRRIDVSGNDEIAALARTFNAMLDRIEQAFATQRQFIDDASHELRTPITIVRGHLELLELGDVDDRRAAVELVTGELDRMHRMVEELLLLARSERPDFVRPRVVELHELTIEVFDKSRALGDREWALDGVAEATVTADPERLTQALLQLAHNAVAHTQDGDRIGIGSAPDDGGVRLWVSDVGPGVDPADAERIFERFSRVQRPDAPRTNGSGLGLAIVRAIAEGHGGTVDVTETEGGGATFTIRLPAATLADDEPSLAGAT